jgi:hypothetical protein
VSEDAKKEGGEDELAALDAELDRLADKESELAKTRELEVKRLRVQYAKEIGREGRDFAVIDTLEGAVVVRRVQAIVLKRWHEAISGDKEVTAQKAFELVAPGIVVPDKETFKAWFIETPSVALKVGNALLEIHGEVDKDKRSKR